MLVTLREILTKAKKEGYAVPAVNVDNDNNVRAALDAAEEMNSPLILNMVPTANPDMEFFGPVAAEMARRSSQFICLNLDHGKTFGECMMGVRSAFTNIMIDRSTLPFDENVRQVKEMVEICHALGLTVEGELGHVGMGDNYAIDGNQALTDVEEAAAFVEATGVDALAVAIGTAHGVYKGEPHIRFELLHKLRDALPIPLVLHGGSGSGDENLSRCAREGINKLNLSNDLKRAAIENLVSRELGGNTVYQLYPLLAEGFKNKVKHYIALCGCAGR